MKKARIFNNGIAAGELFELDQNRLYKFSYYPEYVGDPVSLTIPLSRKLYEFDTFPPFFEGLLPEGIMLENLIRTAKIDTNDFFSQLVFVGGDLVGVITVEEIE